MHFDSFNKRRNLCFFLVSAGLLGASNLANIAIAAEPAAVPLTSKLDSMARAELPLSAEDWPWWRGPQSDNIARGTKLPPTTWSADRNIRWKCDIPGRGYGSPIVVGEKIYLLTSNEETGSQSLLIIDRLQGKLIRSVELHATGGMRKNSRSTAASSTPASDGERIFVTLPNDGAIWVTALELDGDLLWRQKVSDYVEHQGYGASPAIYEDMVIVCSDNKAGGAITSYERGSGKVRWSHQRPKLPNYPSPIILHVNGQDQLIMTGCDLVTSLNPKTGDVLWETEGATTECVTTTSTDGKHIYTSGGYPRNHMSAFLADGSKKKVWENENRLYVPSAIIKDGTLFAVLDAGIAIALDAATGQEHWKKRLNGNFSSSPVLIGDQIFATNEAGETFVYKASPESYEAVSKNKLGTEVFATPVISHGTIYYRCTEDEGSVRKEVLYCIGEPS